MRTDLDHLPAAKQRELERVVQILFEGESVRRPRRLTNTDCHCLPWKALRWRAGGQGSIPSARPPFMLRAVGTSSHRPVPQRPSPS
jgi:hypothetical protein